MAVTCRLPRLLGAGFAERERLRPVSMGYQLKLNTVSMASMTLPETGTVPTVHEWVELYTVRGSIGYYRVTTLARRYTQDVTATLMHGIDTLSDNVWRERDKDFSGTVAGFLQQLLSWQTTQYWQLGTVADTGNYKKSGINYTRLSDLLWEMAESRHGYTLAYDFSTTPWTLSFVALADTPEAEWRITRNMRSCQIQRNDSDLCTRLHLTVSTTTESSVTGYTPEDIGGRTVPAVGTDDTIKTTDTSVRTYNNATAQAVYGIVEKTADIDTADVGDPDAWASKFLSDRAQPQLQITIDGYELAAATGDSWDAFDLGKLTRVALPDSGEVFHERVVGITYPDPLGEPETVTVELANRLARFSESLGAVKTETAKAASTASKASRGGGSSNKDMQHWAMVVKKAEEAMDGTGLRELWESGIELDAQQGVRLYSLTQGLVSQHAEITVHSNKIGLVVEGTTPGSYKIKSASIITAINDDASGIYLNADKIFLNGQSIASQLTALNATLLNMQSDNSTIEKLNAHVLKCSQLVFNTYSMHLQTITVGSNTYSVLCAT